jgi:L,D-transpeptidase-like protein
VVSADPGPYRAVKQSGPGSVARLRAKVGVERFLDILKLNRLDRAHALAADTLLLPGDSLSLMDMSPWPERLSGSDSIPKALLVSLRVQAFAAYERGKLTRWGPVSSGGPNAPSRTGLYFACWKARQHVSTEDTTWIMPWTVNIDPEIGTALHQYSLPGVPASHCCIRLLEEDAAWIYDWVSTWTVSRDGRKVLARGTPVLLLGAYDYEAPPPWKRLAVDPRAADVTPVEVESAARLLRGAN